VGSIGGSNLPEKSNFQGHKGFDAITGKSNFDISEWMLINMLGWFSDRRVTFAMLCKTAVARKALIHAWKHAIPIRSAMYLIDAKKEFNVSVDACLLIAEASNEELLECPIYPNLEATKPRQTIGYQEEHLVAEVSAYRHCRHLIGTSPFKWRSGIKHDCSKVMEFAEDEDGKIVNGLGETVELEKKYLYPMLKSSCVANGRITKPRKWMLVPQRAVNEATDHIAEDAPKTWKYLMRHKSLLEKRGSSIYKNRPSFSIFGVGDYSFAPWKIAISGFYHNLEFQLVGNYQGKPIVVDDTINFIPCQSKEEAALLLRILTSQSAKKFFDTFVFWDAKRPITTEILQKLNLSTLAFQLGEIIPVGNYMRAPLSCFALQVSGFSGRVLRRNRFDLRGQPKASRRKYHISLYPYFLSVLTSLLESLKISSWSIQYNRFGFICETGAGSSFPFLHRLCNQLNCRFFTLFMLCEREARKRSFDFVSTANLRC